MWTDKGTHWAWHGGPEGYTNPPTEKFIDYGHRQFDGYQMFQAVGVYDRHPNGYITYRKL